MNSFFRFASAAALLAGSFLRSEVAAAGKTRSKVEMEAATQLQVFLDRAEFGPGKIDGRYGEFTVKALDLYRQARGMPPLAGTGKAGRRPDTAPDVSGLDLASANPIFISYAVTEGDLQSIGEVPKSVSAQAKLKILAYREAAEAIAEKFHTDVDFLAELNPGKTRKIKAGDQLCVPNVEPFELAAVKDLQPGSEVASEVANDLEDVALGRKKEELETDNAGEATQPTLAVKVNTKTNMLTVSEAGILRAAYPVTVGSERTESPLGDWKANRIVKMPNFRYDKAMLNNGVRSDRFHVLPPGPNNPVGVIWIALNKKGIGLHGTNEPDQIGRSASHGCVRLANWDIVRLAAKVTPGVLVTIE